MTLLGPLWLWVFVDLPLAFLLVGLWQSIRHMPHPLPLDEEERRYRRIPRPITHSEVMSASVVPVWGITATSAYAGPIVIARGS